MKKMSVQEIQDAMQSSKPDSSLWDKNYLHHDESARSFLDEEVPEHMMHDAIKGECLSKHISPTELGGFRRMTGDPEKPFDWDVKGVRKYCEKVGYAVPVLPSRGLLFPQKEGEP